MIRICARVVLLVALVWVAAGVASAQVATGTPSFGSFNRKEFETINLANLNAHFGVPVIAKPGRGMPFNYTLTYDSSVWYPVGASGSQIWQPVQNWGWRGQTEVATGFIAYWTATIRCYDEFGPYWGTRIGGWTYHDTFGAIHTFNIPPYNACTELGGGIGVATDSSGYTLDTNAGAIYPRSGGAIYPPFQAGGGPPTNTVTDRNGNQISVNGSLFYDTLNATTPVLTVSGQGTPASPLNFAYTSPANTQVSVVLNYTTYTLQTSFGCSGIAEYGPTSISLVSSIALPDDTPSNPDRYTITYEQTPGHPANVTGRIASITLPTGGTITYAYTGGSNGIVCADGSAAGLIRTIPSPPQGQWTYARTPGTGASYTTTVTDPQNNQTVIQFQGIYETQRQVYQGSSSSGTLLKTTVTCYNGNTANCNTTAVGTPITRKTVFVQLPGGLQSERDTFYNSFGLATEEDEYGYGNPGPGPLLRKKLITFAALGNYLNSFSQIVTVQDGSGNIVSQTTHTYDEGTPGATSGTPQHVAVTGARGNLTSVIRLVQGTTSLSRTYTYYDTGNLSTFTDTNGAVTTSNYSSSGSCGNSFVTSLGMPLGLSRSMIWNCSGGVVTSVTDENGQVASTTYNDPYFWRPTVVTDAASNATNLSYANPNTAESILLFNNNQSTLDVLTTLDAVGRPKLTQRRQAPGSANFDTIETDHDVVGRPYRTTVAYVGTAGQANSSAAATTRLYDALGRDTQTTDGGGGILSKTHIQNDILRTLSPVPSGENTKRKQLEYDALGRLASVCEITAAAGSGTCAQTSPQTGYWTKYAYDNLGNLTGVTQNAQSSSTQSRTYVYDMLGRMTSETNPETGITSYTFDSGPSCTGNSNGDLIKKVDAVGNTTCYTYDSYHRVTSITYSGPYAASTPNKYLVYDSATVNGVSMVNTKARLAEAYTAACSSCAKITDMGYSYTPRGEISDVYQSTPHSGGYYHLNSTYWANKEVNQLSGLPGLPALAYGVDGEGRAYSVSAGSGQNPVVSTLYNAFEKPTAVNFGSGDSDAFSYDPNTGRVTQYNFTVNGQSLVGNLVWNPNRTLSSLNITDPFNSADTQNCSYSYDDLKRLGSANCGSAWSQTFTYDPFGNIGMSGTGSFQPTYSASTNRILSLPGFTPTYDADGNLLNDGIHTYTWDAEGHPVSIDAVSLTYDALGRMVEQNRSGSYTQITYAPTGSKLALMNGQALTKAYVPLPSGATAVYTSAGLSYYRHADWLGSSRLASTPSRTIYSDSAYSPFGQSYAQSGNTDAAFTGQNQDTVSGLYDFPAREFSPAQGRWISPDPSGVLSVNPINPKTWNRYVYSLDNPLAFVDPNGECSEPPGLQPGQIGVCIDLYIAAPTIPTALGSFLYGVGDNRGPIGNDPNATFRVEYQIVVDPQNNFATTTVITSPSHVEFLGLDLSLTGNTTGDVIMTANSDGSVSVSIDTASINGFAGAPGAPEGTILLDTSLTIYADGSVSVDGGSRSAFPSIEIWSYQSGQDPFNVLSMPETQLSDLGSLNQEIPDVSNFFGDVTVTPDGADWFDGGWGGGGGWDWFIGWDDIDEVLLRHYDPVRSAGAGYSQRRAELPAVSHLELACYSTTF